MATFLTVNLLKAIAGTIKAFRFLINAFIDGLNVLSSKLGVFDEIQRSALGEESEKNIRSIIEAYKTMPEPVAEAAETVQPVATAMERQETAIQKAKKSFEDYAETAREVESNLANAALKGVKTLEDSLVGIVTGATDAKEAFRSMAQSILADIARIVIQEQISAPIAAALGGLFGKKAIGGSVQRGRPVMVGERGAELFVPSSSGSIVSNRDLASAGVAGGGITVNQTINVTTGVQQTVRSEIVNLMPQIANATKAAVADSRLRGGSFSKAFGG